MVILGERSIREVLKKDGKIKAGIQAIVQTDSRKNVYFYVFYEIEIYEHEIQKEIGKLTEQGTIEYEPPQDSDEEEFRYKKAISEKILERLLEKAVEEVNTKRMIIAQGRGISTDKISEVQKYVNLM